MARVHRGKLLLKLATLTFVLYLTCSVHGQGGGTIRPVTGTDEERCETLNTTIPASSICTSINYTSVHVPNLRGHETQLDAINELDDFISVIDSGCSGALRHFLCSYYLPLCYVDTFNGNQPVLVKPCRSVCEYVRESCEPVIVGGGGIWPPHFNCSNEESFGEPPTCFAFEDIGTQQPASTDEGPFTTEEISTEEVEETNGVGFTPDSGAIPNGAPLSFVTMVICILGVLAHTHL